MSPNSISCLLCGTGFPAENDLTFHYMTYTLLELAEALTKVTKERIVSSDLGKDDLGIYSTLLGSYT